MGMARNCWGGTTTRVFVDALGRGMGFVESVGFERIGHRPETQPSFGCPNLIWVVGGVPMTELGIKTLHFLSDWGDQATNTTKLIDYSRQLKLNPISNTSLRIEALKRGARWAPCAHGKAKKV